MITKNKIINGIFLLDKPLHLSSNGALQRVKRLFGAKKAGHTGSLDPLATGMLPICFGEATKFSQFLLDSDKYYSVVAKFGEKTSTGDSEGEVIETSSFDHVTVELFQQTLTKFLGVTQQIPPMFSALKHKGKPLYELARQGIEIDRPAREIEIFSMTGSVNVTHFSLAVHCSKGTYIRTLVEDIAAAMNSCAHVVELRRTKVTPYQETQMITLSELENVCEQQGQDALQTFLLPVDSSILHLPAVALSAASAFYMRTGNSVKIPDTLVEGLVRIFSENNEFMGVGELLVDGRLAPRRLVCA